MLLPDEGRLKTDVTVYSGFSKASMAVEGSSRPETFSVKLKSSVVESSSIDG